jgi:hypothetical protein
MAQVYFIGSIENRVVKIGMTTDNDSAKRMSQIQTGCPFSLKLIGFIKCNNEKDARLAERKLHAALSLFRMNGEWFKITPFVESVLAEIESFGSGEIVCGSYYPSPIICNILQRSIQPKAPELSKDFIIDLLSAALIDANKRNAAMMASFEVMKVCFDKFSGNFTDAATASFTTNPSDAESRAEVINCVLVEAMHKKCFEPLTSKEILHEFVVYSDSDLEDAICNSKVYDLRNLASR